MASKSRRNRVKFKWTKELFFLIGALLVMIVVTIVLAIPSRAERQLSEVNEAITSYNTDNSTTYYTIQKDNHLAFLSHSDLVNQKSSSDYTIVWYGSLTDATYLEQLSTFEGYAVKYEVAKVYLYYSTFVDDAKTNETTETLTYKNELKKMEDELNANKEADAEAISLEKSPSVFVFKDGKLVYNSQVAGDSGEYNYELHFHKAFGYTKL